MNKETFIKGFVLSTMIGLYIIVSLISTLHVIEFFKMSNPDWLAISLAIAFEIGAAASLASIIMLDKTSKTLVWGLFILLTAMQIQGNMFYAYSHLENFQDWIDLFGLQEEELITQKRILSIVSGAILPIIALGFIKSLVDYIKPNQQIKTENKSIENISSLAPEKTESTGELVANDTIDSVGKSTDELEIEVADDSIDKPTDELKIEVADDSVNIPINEFESIQKPKVSPNHEFYTKRGLIKAKDLLESDEIQKPKPGDEPINKKTVSFTKTHEDSIPIIDEKTGNIIIEPKVSVTTKNYPVKP